MTKEAQRIAIATACGWTCIQESEYKPFGVPFLVGYPPKGEPNLLVIPDYLNDLNAMHEAENLFYGKWNTVEGADRMVLYSRFLVGSCQFALHATAAQRAEAFLRSLNLWTE